ncbi:MAG: AarF/ABC1/UbiB kinase family protein [Labilithrix sp.]|nr:AarF/ABC1/UbiB kinase family protein [Labilithrix sp.]MCW5835232.1 AarF/ABC1/UbiB kinase family protein [Labilithrix sp.]
MSDDEADRPTSEKRPHAPPASRLGRLARLGALSTRALPVATEAVRRAAFGKRSDAAAEREAQRRVLENAKKTAEAMLKTLGEMKGLPLKLGQMASYIDGLAPPGYEEKFQEVLKKLQAKAPPLSREAAEKVVTKELGPPEEIFGAWEPDPFAAASIGQVHRATTRSGDRVAVKVQYPDIDKAIVNDLKSISMLESMIAPVGRKYHSKETLDEIKAVFLAELDYGLEAENAEMFRRIHDGDEGIVVPRVWNAFSTKRVLTLEMIDGEDYASFCARADQDERNAASATIWRFMFRSLFKHGVLYADPHPGNYRFLGGGRVAFLDYGCVKKMPAHLLAGTKRYITTAMDGDWEGFERACVEVLGYDRSDPESFKLFVDYSKMILEPLTTDGTFRHTHAIAREAVAFLVRGGKRIMKPKEGEILPNLPKPIHMPQDHTFMNRLQWGLASVMAGLGGEGNWRRIAEPWIRGPYEEI